MLNAAKEINHWRSDVSRHSLGLIYLSVLLTILVLSLFLSLSSFTLILDVLLIWVII